MTMVPSIGSESISLRIASTATWSDLCRSPCPIVWRAGDGRLLDDAEEIEREVGIESRWPPWPRRWSLSVLVEVLTVRCSTAGSSQRVGLSVRYPSR